jgi:hypothetical protein
MNALPRQIIEFAGRRFRVVSYSGDLWRADRQTRGVGSLASNNYAGTEIKYFTTAHHEVASYSSRGMPHVKLWRPQRALVLIDMMDPATREAVRAMMADPAEARALNTAFPVAANGSIYRVSGEDTAGEDDRFLEALCRTLTFADGYYMPAQVPREVGVGSFHSEVGLCRRALRELVLFASRREGPPPAPNNATRRRRRPNRNNENRNRNRNRNRHRSRSRNRFVGRQGPMVFNSPPRGSAPGVFGAMPPSLGRRMMFDD